MKEKENVPAPAADRGFFREMQIEFLIHELKDPLAIIEAGIRSLLEKQDRFGELTPRQEKSLDRVLRNSRKAREMLQDLLEVGRSEAGSVLKTSFQPARCIYDVLLAALEIKSGEIYEQVKSLDRIDQALSLLKQKGIHYDIMPPLDDLEIYQDQTKFAQIISNLIKNALHYRSKRLDIRLSCESNQLMVEVVDDGPGISPEHHEAIFKRYTQVMACETLSRQSHGLGLAGAKIIASCLGGDIRIESEAGCGTTFLLILPTLLEDQPV